MYGILLTLHSLTRWAVVILALLGLVRALTGKDAPWSAADETPRRWLPHAMSLQLVLGLGLWFGLSPVVALARADMAAAMKDPLLRFWAVEHFAAMFVAVTLVHVGAARARKAATPAAKRQAMLIFFGIATAITLWAVPWTSRPLFRMGAPVEVPTAAGAVHS